VVLSSPANPGRTSTEASSPLAENVRQEITEKGSTMFWRSTEQDHVPDRTCAVMADRCLEPSDLDAEELTRAHGALAYLKARIGNDRMRELLADDLAETTKRTEAYATQSTGWKDASFRLVLPGPDAATFHQFFLDLMKHDRELEMRAGHPDHFLNHPVEGGAQVIENLGEDDLPWYIELTFSTDQEKYTVSWDDDYPERVGAIIFNSNGTQIGTAMHEMRDTSDGMEIKFTVILPDAAPDALLHGHLRHFAVEWRNWARLAREELAEEQHSHRADAVTTR